MDCGKSHPRDGGADLFAENVYKTSMNRVRNASPANWFSLTVRSAVAVTLTSALSTGCVTGDELAPGLIEAANDRYFRGTNPPANSNVPGGEMTAAPLPGASEPPVPTDDELIPPDALTLEQWLAGEVAPSSTDVQQGNSDRPD